MEKPRLNDFDLNERQFEEIKLYIENCEEKSSKYGCLIFLLIPYPVFVLLFFPDFDRAAFIISLPLTFLLSFFGTLVLYSFVGNRIKRKHKKYFEYVDAKKKYDDWFVRTQKEFWEALSGRAFEIETANLLKRTGYNAKLLGGSADGGVDIILDNDTIIQCKSHKSPVSPAVVRELYGTLQHFKASKAILISRTGFTKGVYEFVQGKPILLWDLNSLIKLQKETI